jgi:hypothetical protein
VFVDQIQVVAQNVLENRIDVLGVFVGIERFGKSTLLSRAARVFGDVLHTEVKLKRDYHYELDKFTRDLMETTYSDNEGKFTPKKGGKHFVKVYDEPVLGANARKWASEGNTVLNSTLAVVGFKYHVILAGIPSWWMLDNIVREHRTAFLARVRGKVDEKGIIQKGYFDLYNGRALRRIHRDRQSGETIYPPTKFSEMRFESMEGTAFWNEYEEFSPKAKQNAVEELIKRAKALRPADKPITDYDIEKVLYGVKQDNG